jgi:putative protease
MAEEKEVGKVLHYFGKASAASIKLSGDLKVGDTIHIKGHTTDITQPIESMMIGQDPVTEAKAGDDIGIKVKDHVREHDVVFKVIG